MFDTINFDTSDLRPVLITGPARTTTARELIDTITDAVTHPPKSAFVGILDSADLSISEDLRGLIAAAPDEGMQLIILARTEAVPADLRVYLREVAA